MNEKYRFFTESVVLAAIPALGYWVAFVYELGYFNYFGLPTGFIEIALNSILLNSLSVVSGLLLFIIIFDYIRRAMLGVTEALKYTLYKLMLAYFLIFGFALVFDRPINERLILLSIVVGPIIVTELLWPLWSYRHIKGFGKKVSAAKKKDFEFESLTDKIAEKTGEGSFLLLVFIYLISIFSYFVGGYQANKQEYFLTSEAKPNYVLIRKYGNEWLALKVDEKSQVFSQTYELIPTNMINAFSSTNVGKLKAWQEDSLND